MKKKVINVNHEFENSWYAIYEKALDLIHIHEDGFQEQKQLSKLNLKRMKKLFKLLQKGY